MAAEDRPYHLRRLRLMASLLRKGTLLDIGCTERSLRGFAAGSEYIGVDLREGDVMASAEALPFRDESFDSIGCGEVIEHLRSPRSCIDEIRRVLKDDGTAVLTTPNLGTLFHGTSFLEHPGHINCMDYSRLLSMLGRFREIRRHGFDVFLEAPLHGWAGVVPYPIRRAFAKRFLPLEKILVVELRK
jgi:SAM-dependent methyltransferase